MTEHGVTFDKERVARAYLLHVAEPPAPALVALVEEKGPILAAELVRAGDCSPAVHRETAARRESDKGERNLVAADHLGARLVIPEDDEWPAWPLLSMEVATCRGVPAVAPPLGLWVQGRAKLADTIDGAVAIVGARAATNYGEHFAAELAHGLAQRDISVFSGAAYGIDGAAHRGALATGGTTVAVLGCGMDAGYPAGHIGLLGKIVEHGLVVSEYAPGVTPARHRFLVRNRLIAALTEGTVVVEAGARSGARNTATTAGLLGKVVMAVPGHVGSAMSIGCHQLIRDSAATLVGSVSEVLETVGRLGVVSAGRPDIRRATDGLSDQALRVYETLVSRQGKSAEQIAVEAGIALERVRALLPALELAGLGRYGESGWCQATPTTRKAAA